MSESFGVDEIIPLEIQEKWAKDEVAKKEAELKKLGLSTAEARATIADEEAEALAQNVGKTDFSPEAQKDREQFLERSERVKLALETVGIPLPKTRLAPGHALWDVGVQALASTRRRVLAQREAGQTGDKVLPIVTEALKLEDRKDIPVKVKDLRLDSNGRLWRDGAIKAGKAIGPRKDGTVLNALGYSKHAFGQLVAQIRQDGGAAHGLASSLLTIDPDLRAEQFNRWAPKVEVEAEATLRTKRTDDGQRVLRAALSGRYGDCTDLHIAEGLRDLQGLDQAVLDYKPDTGNGRSQFDLVWHSEIPIKLFRVGDVLRGTVRISNSETGQGSVQVIPGVVLAACANLTEAAEEGVIVKLTHLGNGLRIRNAVKAAIAQAAAQIESVVAVIKDAKAEIVGTNIADIIAKITAGFKEEYNIKVEEEVAKSWVSTYESSYASYEPKGVSLYGVHSAITEAAQTRGWWASTSEEEAMASKVLYAKVGLA